jgi:hypothetical protein
MSLKSMNDGINSFEYGQAVSGNAETFFSGGFQGNVITRDPKISGYAFIKWIQVPSWVTSQYPSFQTLTERNLRSFNGLTDIDMQSMNVQEGFSASEIAYAGGISNFQGFSMTHREFQGSPMKNLYTHWVSGIRDPRTNVATYPKAYGLKYSAANHTGKLMYITTTPDADNYNAGGQIIESATLWEMVQPTRIPFGADNFTAGTNDGVEIEEPFLGVPVYGATVNKMAAALLPQLYSFIHMNETEVE